MKFIKDEPEIEVEYLKDEDEEYKMIKDNVENDNNIEKNSETPKTEGTGFEETQENNFANIMMKDKKTKTLYQKEEYISGNNSENSSISL